MKTKNAKLLFPLAIAGVLISSFAFANDESTGALQSDSGSVVQSWVILPPPPPPPESDSGKVEDFHLSGRITAAYKVTLKWPKFITESGITLEGYKLTVSSSGVENTIVSITPDKTTIDNWNAKQSSLTTYVLSAITSDGESHNSNPVVIAMGPNGQADFSLGTPRNSTNPPANNHDRREEKPEWRNGSGSENGSGSYNHNEPTTGSGWVNKKNHPIAQEIKREIKQEIKRSVFSKKVREALSTRLDSFPTDQKEAKFKEIIAKIDTALASVKWALLKAKLYELRIMVSNKLDDLTSDNTNDSLINEILGGSTWDTTK